MCVRPLALQERSGKETTSNEHVGGAKPQPREDAKDDALPDDGEAVAEEALGRGLERVLLVTGEKTTDFSAEDGEEPMIACARASATRFGCADVHRRIVA